MDDARLYYDDHEDKFEDWRMTNGYLIPENPTGVLFSNFIFKTKFSIPDLSFWANFVFDLIFCADSGSAEFQSLVYV